MSEGMKIASLTTYSREVNVLGKIVGKSEERSVTSRYGGGEHRVCDSTIADETGAITLVLWDDNIDKVNEGDVVRVGNGYVKVFRGAMQLNVGRYGTLEPSTEVLEDVNTENNLSEKEVQPRYGYRSGPRRGAGRGGYRRGRGSDRRRRW